MSYDSTRLFVELFYPGTLFSETEEIEVAARTPKALAKKYSRCFALQFYEQVCRSVVIDGATRMIRGPKRKLSAKFFPDGEVMTVADVKKKVKDSHILVSNMEGNGWKQVVKTRCGNFQPFEKDCKVIAL